MRTVIWSLYFSLTLSDKSNREEYFYQIFNSVIHVKQPWTARFVNIMCNIFPKKIFKTENEIKTLHFVINYFLRDCLIKNVKLTILNDLFYLRSIYFFWRWAHAHESMKRIFDPRNYTKNIPCHFRQLNHDFFFKSWFVLHTLNSTLCIIHRWSSYIIGSKN